VLKRSFAFGAMLVGAAAVPAFAAVAQAPAPKPAAPAAAGQSLPNRAAVVRNLDATFKNVDTNGDGSLNSAEIAAAETKAQQQRATTVRSKVEAEFTKLDTNKDGSLSKSEFMAAAPQPKLSPPNPAGIIAQLDKNKDGKVSADEYRAPILARFDKADTNKDGTISGAERQAATKAQK